MCVWGGGGGLNYHHWCTNGQYVQCWVRVDAKRKGRVAEINTMIRGVE